MAAALRKTPSQIRSILFTKVLFLVDLEVASAKPRSFKAKVTTADSVAGDVPTAPVVSYLADAKGKVKTYKSLDPLMADLIDACQANELINFNTFPIADLLVDAPSNPVGAAKSERNRLIRSITAAENAEAKAGATLIALSSYAGGSADQVAAYDEAVAQKDAITASKGAMTARKNELDTFIAANGG